MCITFQGRTILVRNEVHRHVRLQQLTFETGFKSLITPNSSEKKRFLKMGS
ncbi:predicted protein [Sclerotinia sclerotiorum 1980 UF-70]|uniref:Uncharacterized protein n=1 Tax=Sclerotinia sclerotiorum (strain ATCC 18683 / 1980 / Ss-1) TaxID=665079 RepID=A7EBE0_SCLS1|nr:predicted protein [Sclerotinia sclerotiorum 1980 UF-70]EDN99768.1 predicted protein [Sclerotinia sclerotiorum 1980 UF-70]